MFSFADMENVSFPLALFYSEMFSGFVLRDIATAFIYMVIDSPG
jgi:hypothetical protein